MAEFCQQCSIEMFDKDFKEFANLGNGKVLQPDMVGKHCVKGVG